MAGVVGCEDGDCLSGGGVGCEEDGDCPSGGGLSTDDLNTERKM